MGAFYPHKSQPKQELERGPSRKKGCEARYNRVMKCPVCSKDMKKVRWDISYNPDDDNKSYDRTVYQCLADDVWVTTEIPKDD